MAQLTIQQAFEIGLRHHQNGQVGEAERIYRQILAYQPGHADSLHLLGVIAYQAGRYEEAVKMIGEALAINPNYAAAHSNLGNALRDKGDLAGAVAAYERAIGLQPNFEEAFNNLGIALGLQGKWEEAVGAYRRAIELKADYAEAYYNLGIGLWEEGNVGEAMEAYRRAVGIKPDFVRAHDNLILTMHYEVGSSAAAMAEELRVWNQRHAEGLGGGIKPHLNERDPERRLRVGYVSADFWGHASGLFLVGLLEHHDPREGEVFCYAEDSRVDGVTERLRRCAAAWRSTVGVSDEGVTEMIRGDGIDILVDLKLHTSQNRLLVFARKPAPVQVTWLGYPGSTGLRTVDYRLSDPYLDPVGGDESVYSEKTVRLADSFWCYKPFEGEDIGVNALPAIENGVVTFGCMNTFCKINDGVLGVFARVLGAVDGSRLLLLAGEGEARRRTIKVFEREGISLDRVAFISRQPRGKYLEVYHRIDVGLDSFPCNGNTTSLDSFWMGVPVITMVGETTFGRAGLSQLMNLGLGELAARTEEAYVEIAKGLAGDLGRLGRLRLGLRGRMEGSALMDAGRFARNVEKAYREMWRKWCAKRKG